MAMLPLANSARLLLTRSCTACVDDSEIAFCQSAFNCAARALALSCDFAAAAATAVACAAAAACAAGDCDLIFEARPLVIASAAHLLADVAFGQISVNDLLSAVVAVATFPAPPATPFEILLVIVDPAAAVDDITVDNLVILGVTVVFRVSPVS